MIIADDERRICALIRGLLDWESLGIQIIGETYSGTSVLSMIRRLKPDIVITDICMPGLNGLDMISRIQEEGISCEFILISGHKNFEYAHSAIRYGIRNYILKPLNEEDLRDNVLNVRRRILEAKNMWDSYDFAIKKATRSRELSEKCLMQDFVSGKAAPDKMTDEELGEIYNIDFCPGGYFFVVIKPITKVEMNETQYSIILEKAQLFFRDRLEKAGINRCSIIYEECVVMIVNSSNEAHMQNCLLDILDDAMSYFLDYCTLSVGQSSVRPYLANEMANEARIALMYRVDKPQGQLIAYDESMDTKNALPLFSQEEITEFLTDIRILNVEGVRRWTEQLWRLVNESVSAPSFFASVYQFIYTARSALEELCWDAPHRKLDIVSVIKCIGSRTEIVSAAGQWLLDALNEYTEQKNSQQRWYVRTAKAYVCENYGRNISLSDVSERLHINSSYFSSLFKKEEGITFSDYLISCRMDAAKKLLKTTNDSISEIGQAVGYEDVSYFSKMFKKAVGIRPKEYRKLYL